MKIHSGQAIVDPSAKKTVNFQVTDKERKVTFDLQRDDGKYNSYEWNGNVGEVIVKLGETYGELPSCFMSETFCEGDTPFVIYAQWQGICKVTFRLIFNGFIATIVNTIEQKSELEVRRLNGE